jgi:OOP family OmpA-OmpF porin
MTRVATALALSGAILFGARAAAASCTTPIVSPCVDSDTFWPHPGPSQFITIGGTETVQVDRFAAGLVGTYLSRPIVLQLPSAPGSPRAAVDNQLDATFLFAYGLTDRLELDLALPVTIFQDGAGTSPLTGGGDLPATATRDMRFGLTYAFVTRPAKHPWRHDASGFGLAARFETVAPTGDDDAFAAERGGVFVPSIDADFRSYRFSAGAELGARIRPVADFAGARIGTQGVIAAGVGFDVLPKHDLLTLGGELRMLPVFTEQATVTQTANGLSSSANGTFIMPMEWLATARSAPFEGGDLTFELGVGGSIPTSVDPSGTLFAPVTSPRVRVVLGVTFAPLGRDTDDDGVPDADDRCPLEPGPKSSGAGPGCPEKAVTPPP